MLPILEQLQSPLLEEAKAITELSSIIDLTEGVLLEKSHLIQNPQTKKRITRLLNA